MLLCCCVYLNLGTVTFAVRWVQLTLCLRHLIRKFN